MNDREKFFQLLETLATLTGFKATESIYLFYESNLQRHGYAKACLAIADLCKKAKRWPTIDEIERQMGVCPEQPKISASEVALKIWGAISKFGSWNAEDALEYIGPEGRYIVELNGGWDRICDTPDESNKTIFVAQWRNALETKMACGFDFLAIEPENQKPALTSSQIFGMIEGGKN